MKKRIVICSDGTWNRPEKDITKDFPTNVMRMARSIKPIADDKVPQQVFYDWGIGSYGSIISRGADGITGNGLHKNIMDAYRYIVQNYKPGDDLYLFGFSRGAYTVRSLCGLINNCGILQRNDANKIQQAFNHYKKISAKFGINGTESIKFRKDYSHPNSQTIRFVGVWDTVGSLGIPSTLMGLFDSTDEFYDNAMGANIHTARHALAIDEKREDFAPTIWIPRDGVDMQQVWFAGVHSDIGGSYKPAKDGSSLSTIPLNWMSKEAKKANLSIETHLNRGIVANPLAKLHDSKRHIFRLKSDYHRKIIPTVYDPRDINRNKKRTIEVNIDIHSSVKKRYNKMKYKPPELAAYLTNRGGQWPKLV